MLQLLVATGRPYGRFVWGGQHDVLPRGLRVGSALAVLLYAGFAFVLLRRAAAGGPPGRAIEIATWVLVAYFVMGIGLNAISRSRAERAVMTPACLLLAACSLVLALD